MSTQQRWTSTAGLAAAILAVQLGCASPQEPEQLVWAEPGPQMPTSPVDTEPLPVQAFVDRSLAPGAPEYIEAHADEIAQHPLAVFQLRLLLSENGVALADALRERNPDIVILGVMQVLSRPGFWDDAGQRERYPFSGDLFDLLASSTAVTTTGDIPPMWDNAPMITPMRHGQLNITLQERILETVVRHAVLRPRAFDGMLHDYMSPSPWIWPDPAEAGIGEVDLDRDGIGFSDDPVEQEMWVGWQARLIDRLQELFGPGLIQIANGRLALVDSAIAARLAGVWIQHFPTTAWNETDREGLDMALEHIAPGYFAPRRGRLWSLYAPETASRPGNIDFRRHTSFLTGQFYVYKQSRSEEFFGRDPVREELGAPLGGVEVQRQEDGSATYERRFELGTVRIEVNAFGHTTALVTDRL